MKLFYWFSTLFLLSHGLSAQPTNYIQREPPFNSPGTYNTMVGPGTGLNVTTGGYNVFMGTYAGGNTSTGSFNLFLGYGSGAFNTVGQNNVYLGHATGTFNTNGSNNVFVGKEAGYANQTGGNNSFLGNEAGKNNVSGSSNVFVGTNTGRENTVGVSNTFVGTNAGQANTTGQNNVFLGRSAGFQTSTGVSNVFVGVQAGYNTTTAGANVFVGHQAGFNNKTGIGNMFLGQQAGANSNGSYNLFLGNSAGSGNISGEGNTAVGDGSFLNSTSGVENTAVGRYAGINNTTGSKNTFIGVAATNPPGSGNLTNATAIGYNASVTSSNAMILGNNQVNVGIGNTAPNNKLEITKGSPNQSGLRFTNLTSASPASMYGQGKFLTVNDAGDVVLGTTIGVGREGVSESLWQQKGSYLQNSKGDAVIIGTNVALAPLGYRLIVEQGILTEKVKVALKNTSEWSDHVFEKSYSLMPLSEVETHIQKFGHLPGVPSAKDMVEMGNDLLKTDAKLLEKVEELTLYSIQMEKTVQNEKLHRQQDQQKIEQLETELNELKLLVKQLLKDK